jgi:hypothetical protein
MCHIKDIYGTEFDTFLASITLVRIDIHKIDFKCLISFAHNPYLLLEIRNWKETGIKKLRN